MTRDTLLWSLQKMKKEAQVSLNSDGSFLEALQALKWEIDNSDRVRAAKRALRDRGLTAFTSLAPRIYIGLQAGDSALAPHQDAKRWNSPDAQDLDDATRMEQDPLTREVRDAANAVVAASPYCRLLDKIVDEAVQANRAFVKIASSIENAGYELQICLDLSTYAQVRLRSSTKLPPPGHRFSRPEAKRRQSRKLREDVLLPLSCSDMQFLKELRIRP